MMPQRGAAVLWTCRGRKAVHFVAAAIDGCILLILSRRERATDRAQGKGADKSAERIAVATLLTHEDEGFKGV